MTKIHHSLYYQKWVVETELPNYKDYSTLFDKKGLDESKETCTHNGVQINFTKDELNLLSKDIQAIGNKAVEKEDAPIRLGDLLGGWMVRYGSNGWQELHDHGDPFDVITCVLNFSKSNYPKNGSTIVVLPEPDGNLIMKDFLPYPGKLLIMEGSVVHGAYPTTTPRDILVVDFKQEIQKLDDPNN